VLICAKADPKIFLADGAGTIAGAVVFVGGPCVNKLPIFPRIMSSMSQVIFKYPDQKFVGIATRKPDSTLDHQGFALVNVIPKKGDVLFDRPVTEVLTEEGLLKEMSRRALNEIFAVAVLGAKG
jgi:hypothetical protein